MPKHFMIAAAGVSLSKHTMHRTHDPRVETADERRTRWTFDPRASLSEALPAAPLVVGSRAYMGAPSDRQHESERKKIHTPEDAAFRLVRGSHPSRPALEM